MDIILPYVAWISLLAIVMDVGADADQPHAPSPGRIRSGPTDARCCRFRDVWVEYGDKIVLEKVDLDDRARAPSSRSSARRARARAPSCA